MTAAIAAAAVAALLRFQFIEPEAYAHLCGAAGAPWWCVPRAALIAAFGSGALAGAAVGAGLLATATRGAGAGIAAAALGAAGLVLYSVEAGAVGLLLGLLALARPRPRQARGGGEQEA
ncbi:MAG: hypothetical protein U1F45_17285 [Burkholderiales bacterium]